MPALQILRRVAWACVAIIGFLAVTLVLGWWRVDGPGAPQRSDRTSTAPLDIGGSFSLVDHTGKAVTEADFRGSPLAVFFGFTHCPEVCPTTLFELDGWLSKVDPDGSRLQAYFVTVDPERDTPELVGQYVGNVSKRITGISGEPAKVLEMVKGFRVYYRKVPLDEKKPDGDYTMDHTASVFLLDKDGRFTGTIAYGENPETAEQKLANLIKR